MQAFLIFYAAYSAVILAFHLALAAGILRTMILDARRTARTPALRSGCARK